MQLEVGLLFHVFALVGPELASAFCTCTIVPTQDDAGLNTIKYIMYSAKK